MKSNQRLIVGASIVPVLLLIIGGLLFIHHSKSKIAYVNASVLVEAFPEMKRSQAVLEKKTMQWQANIDTLTQEFEQLVNSFEQSKNELSRKESEAALQQIGTKKEQLQAYQRAIEQQYQHENIQMTEKVLSELNHYISEYAEQEGYDLVLGANGDGNIVYATEYMDITEPLSTYIKLKTE